MRKKLDSLSAVKEDLDNPSKNCQKEKTQEDDTAHVSRYLGQTKVSALHKLIRQLQVSEPARHYDLMWDVVKKV